MGDPPLKIGRRRILSAFNRAIMFQIHDLWRHKKGLEHRDKRDSSTCLSKMMTEVQHPHAYIALGMIDQPLARKYT